MTQTTPRPELEPPPTQREPVKPVVGFCFWCNELVLADEGHAYFPPAHAPRLACGGCVARRHDLGVGG